MKIIELIQRGLRALGINTPGLEAYFAFGGGQGTSSGVRINENNALSVAAVYECTRVIADTIASLPCFLYRRLSTGKERAADHPVYRILHEEPNPVMTPFEFKQTMQGHLCLWGKAFAEIEINGGGRVQSLWPLRPDTMRVQFFNGKLFYYYTTPDGVERQIRNVLHFRGLASDGINSYSPIGLQRETLGLAQASEQYRSRFFANDARPGGVLQTERSLGDIAYKRLQKFWDDEHQGLSNRGRTAILEDGVKWQDVGMPPDDAQFIQGQEYQKGDIAAIFRVPAYKIGLLKPGTVSFASVEQQAIDFVIDCIRPWLVCWEERTTLALLTPTERKQYFAEFLVDALLRGDSAQRAAFYTSMFNIGAFTQNQILEKENMNGIGTLGDRRYVPLNMIPVDLVDDVVKAKLQPQQPANPADNTPTEPKMMNGAAH